MKELHVFLDESGDPGFSNDSTARFILSFVFHDAKDDISDNIRKINTIGYVHLGPLIRREEPYEEMDFQERAKIYKKFFSFFAGLPIKCKSFIYEKRKFKNDMGAFMQKIFDDLCDFFRITNPYLSSFDSIIIYYDKGQQDVTRLLTLALASSGLNYSFKNGIKAGNYRLLQVADLIAMIKLIECKMDDKDMSLSEKKFFG